MLSKCVYFVTKILTNIEKNSNCEFCFQRALPQCIITENSDFNIFVIMPLWYELMLYLRNIIHQIHFYNYSYSMINQCGILRYVNLLPFSLSISVCWMKFASLHGNYLSESQFQQTWIYYYLNKLSCKQFIFGRAIL